jgi:hypothetical protein
MQTGGVREKSDEKNIWAYNSEKTQSWIKLRKKELQDLHSSANINRLKMEYVACMYRSQNTFIKLCSAQLKEKRFGGRNL